MKAFLAWSMSLLILSGCATTSQGPHAGAMSTLQLREIQTRRFDNEEKAAVMKALLDALQDDHFVIRSSNSDLGIAYAEKQLDIKDERQLKPSDRIWVHIAIGIAVVGIIALVIWAISKGHPCYSPEPIVVAGDNAASEPEPKTLEIECTANVSTEGHATQVRISLERRLLDSFGAVVKAEPDADPDDYRDLFARLDKSLFIQQEAS
jgi:hypothetical protein